MYITCHKCLINTTIIALILKNVLDITKMWKQETVYITLISYM